jgi:hypothetical protein
MPGRRGTNAPWRSAPDGASDFAQGAKVIGEVAGGDERAGVVAQNMAVGWLARHRLAANCSKSVGRSLLAAAADDNRGSWWPESEIKLVVLDAFHKGRPCAVADGQMWS